MICPSCGVSLAHQTKYRNRCGALVTARDSTEIELFEKRMDSEMEGLFWITVLGVALILGGMVLMKSVQLSEWLIIAYGIISSAAFVTYFGVGVWQVRRLNEDFKGAKGLVEARNLDTNRLNPREPEVQALGCPPSVVEQTTRTLEPVPMERKGR